VRARNISSSSVNLLFLRSHNWRVAVYHAVESAGIHLRRCLSCGGTSDAERPTAHTAERGRVIHGVCGCVSSHIRPVARRFLHGLRAISTELATANQSFLRFLNRSGRARTAKNTFLTKLSVPAEEWQTDRLRTALSRRVVWLGVPLPGRWCAGVWAAIRSARRCVSGGRDATSASSLRWVGAGFGQISCEPCGFPYRHETGTATIGTRRVG